MSAPGVGTWVMEGHKHKGAGLVGAAGSALDDGVSSEAGGGDLLKHAAGGVQDKHQCRLLLHAEEPVQGCLEKTSYVCHDLLKAFRLQLK